MSKFIDKLKHLSDGAPQPMGFRTKVAAAPKPKMLLAAVVSGDDLGNLTGFAAAVDAVLVTAASRTVPDEVAKQLAAVPWGVWLKDAAGLEDVEQTGCDFYVFPLQSPVEQAKSGNQAGRMISLDASLADSMLRAANDLPVDAVFLANDPGVGPFTWERLLVIQRCANLMSKPLLTSVGPEVTAGELQALWTAGIDCVLIEGGTLEQLRSVRQTIDAATFPLPRRRERAGALVPRINHEPHHVTEEEEEE